MPPRDVASKRLSVPDSRPAILLVTPTPPATGGIGQRMRAGAHVRALVRNYRVHLAVMDTAVDGREPLEAELVAPCASVARLPAPHAHAARWRSLGEPSMSRARRIAALATLPPSRALPPSPAELEATVDALSGLDPEAVVCFRISAAVFVEPALARLGWLERPRIVDFDDIESSALARELWSGRRVAGWVETFGRAVLAARMRRLERALLAKSSAVVCCSRHDAGALERRSRGARVAVIPNTVVVPPLALPPPRADTPRLLFVGTLSYGPNRDGLVWFVEKVWPRIQAASGDRCRLVVAGRRPPPDVVALARARSFELHADVPDLAPLYREADLVIAPILSGGGTRIKILEAMAQTRPVVATTIGAEGLDARDGRELLLADTPEAFAAAVCRIADDPALGRRLAETAHAFVRERFSPAVAEERWAETLAGALPRSGVELASRVK